jgi:hypothetical protein
MGKTIGAGDVWLVYDGECPVCTTYCKHARIRDAVGRLHLVDARQPGALMDEITAAGLDIDQGHGPEIRGRDVLRPGGDAHADDAEYAFGRVQSLELSVVRHVGAFPHRVPDREGGPQSRAQADGDQVHREPETQNDG